MELGRVLTAMVTPMTEQLEVDFAQSARLAQRLVQNGSDGLVIAGTTGETPTLSADEKLALFKTVKEAVGDEAAVVANTGSYNTRESIKLTEEAEAAGADAIMLVVPYYNKPSQEALYEHFKTIAQATGLPVILYNVPSRTVANLEPQTVQRLVQGVPNIVAIKEAAGNMDQVSRLRLLTPSQFRIYSGDDSLTLPMLALGAHGVISVASHLVGKEIKKMITAYHAGDPAEALEIHLRLFDLFKGLFIQTNPVPIKAALNLLGFKCGGVRLPLVPATGKEIDLIEAQLKRLGLLGV